MISLRIPTVLGLALGIVLASVMLSRPIPNHDPALKVRILPAQAGESAQSVRLRFENVSSKPILMLCPLDGSDYGWHQPYYMMTLTDAAGRKVPSQGRCGVSGLWADMKWPEDYLIRLKPGETHEMRFSLAHEIVAGGDYEATFTYAFGQARRSPRGPSGIKYPGDTWVGSASAPPVRLTIRNFGQDRRLWAIEKVQELDQTIAAR